MADRVDMVESRAVLSGDGSGSKGTGVLAVFSFTLACNNLLFMSFATTPHLTEEVLGLLHPARRHFDDTGALDWLYTASLITVAVCMVPATIAVDRWNRNTNLVAAVVNAAAAWARYAAADSGSYSMALGSSVMTGVAASVLMPSVALVAGRWYPASQAFAMAIAIQSGYFGWSIGSLIPIVATSAERLKDFLLVQGFMVSLSVPLMLLCYRDPPKSLRSAREASSERSVDTVAKRHHTVLLFKLRANGAFWTHALCTATLEAISFAVPGVQGVLFQVCLVGVSLPPSETLWTNFAFLFSGVCTGLLLAKLPTTSQPAALKLLFVLASVAFTGLVLVSTLPGEAGQPAGGTALLVLLMAAAGGASLGFPGLGLAMVVDSAEDVPEAYSCGVTQLLSQVLGAVLAQLSGCSIGFTLCAGASALAALAMLTLARFPSANLPRTDKSALTETEMACHDASRP